MKTTEIPKGLKAEDEQLIDEQDKQAKMFFEHLGKRTCETCAYAMPFDKSVVCGVWHVSFSSNSFCDHYKTEAERKVELAARKAETLADPNSLLSIFLKKKINTQDNGTNK
jgi:hypothetical protein